MVHILNRGLAFWVGMELIGQEEKLKVYESMKSQSEIGTERKENVCLYMHSKSNVLTFHKIITHDLEWKTGASFQ